MFRDCNIGINVKPLEKNQVQSEFGLLFQSHLYRIIRVVEPPAAAKITMIVVMRHSISTLNKFREKKENERC
jgi:hypothetical protein